eukprot:125470-Hanusia_phi.AAC.2
MGAGGGVDRRSDPQVSLSSCQQRHSASLGRRHQRLLGAAGGCQGEELGESAAAGGGDWAEALASDRRRKIGARGGDDRRRPGRASLPPLPLSPPVPPGLQPGGQFLLPGVLEAAAGSPWEAAACAAGLHVQDDGDAKKSADVREEAGGAAGKRRGARGLGGRAGAEQLVRVLRGSRCQPAMCESDRGGAEKMDRSLRAGQLEAVGHQEAPAGQVERDPLRHQVRAASVRPRGEACEAQPAHCVR